MSIQVSCCKLRTCRGSRRQAGNLPQRLRMARQEREPGPQLPACQQAKHAVGGGHERHVQRLVVDAHRVALEQPVLRWHTRGVSTSACSSAPNHAVKLRIGVTFRCLSRCPCTRVNPHMQPARHPCPCLTRHRHLLLCEIALRRSMGRVILDHDSRSAAPATWR